MNRLRTLVLLAATVALIPQSVRGQLPTFASDVVVVDGNGVIIGPAGVGVVVLRLTGEDYADDTVVVGFTHRNRSTGEDYGEFVSLQGTPSDIYFSGSACTGQAYYLQEASPTRRFATVTVDQVLWVSVPSPIVVEQELRSALRSSKASAPRQAPPCEEITPQPLKGVAVEPFADLDDLFVPPFDLSVLTTRGRPIRRTTP